jgi:hypothetical protein
MKKVILIASIMFLIGSKVFANEPNIQQRPIDFKEAIVIGLENNQELMGMKEALSASEKETQL